MGKPSNNDLLNELDDLLEPETSEGPHAVHPTMVLAAAPPQAQETVAVPDPIKDTNDVSAAAPAPV